MSQTARQLPPGSQTARQLPPGFDDLTLEEQIDYVQFLWERIAPKVDEHPIPAWHLTCSTTD